MAEQNAFALKLRSGHKMPAVGLGTYAPKQGEDEIIPAVKAAVKVGYRHLDCAAIYRNERAVGHAIKQLIVEDTVRRQDLFVTSKLWNTCHRADLVRSSLKKSLDDLGLSYLDLYLIHWPVGYLEGGEFHPKDENGKVLFSEVDFLDTWKALEDCVDEGLVRDIGVSNFNSQQLQKILDIARIKPSNNQVEVHIHLSNQKLLEFCQKNEISVTAYSPLGSPGNKSVPFTTCLEEPVIKELAQKKNKSTAQVILRFLLQRGIGVIPKSVTPARIAENIQLPSGQQKCMVTIKTVPFDYVLVLLCLHHMNLLKPEVKSGASEGDRIFDFKLTEEEMQQLHSLNKNHRLNIETIALDHKYYPFHVEF